MISRKSIMEALLLSAICLCAFGASSASATTIHQCEATKGKGTTRFSDSGCTTKSAAGAFETVPIEGLQKVVPTLTPTTGTSETHAVISGNFASIKYAITCTGLSSANSVAENIEVGGKMGAKGTGKLEFTGCSISLPELPGSGCTVPATIATEEMALTTEDMTVEPKLMTVIFTPVNKENKIATFSMSGCTGSAAFLNGAKTLKGFVRGFVEEALPTSIMFETGKEELTFLGQEANFRTVLHLATKANGALLSFETP
jgi:hypothetical protein